MNNITLHLDELASVNTTHTNTMHDKLESLLVSLISTVSSLLIIE